MFQSDAITPTTGRSSGVEIGDKVKTSSSVFLTVYHDFVSVERVWRAFEAQADCYPFQSFDFLDVWHRTIGFRSDVELHIVVAWASDAKPLMIVPLGVERTRLATKVVWLGNELNDYNAPMIAQDFDTHLAKGAFEDLWNAVLATLPDHDLVELKRQPALIGRQANPFMELPTQLNAAGAHMTVIGDDFDAYYEEKRTKRAKSQFRYMRKQMLAMGDVQYVHPETRDEIAASLDRLTALKSQALTAMGISDFLAQPGYVDFYKELSFRSLNDGIAHVSHMEVDGQYAAGNWGLIFKGRFYYVLTSYDKASFGRLSPGVQTLVETMRWAANRGLSVFDFTIGDESYKLEWCETRIDLHDHLHARTVRGHIVRSASQAFLLMKRTIKQNERLWAFYKKARVKLAKNLRA